MSLVMQVVTPLRPPSSTFTVSIALAPRSTHHISNWHVRSVDESVVDSTARSTDMSVPFPSLPFPSLPFLPLTVLPSLLLRYQLPSISLSSYPTLLPPPHIQLGAVGERCKLCQCDREHSPSRKRICRIFNARNMFGGNYIEFFLCAPKCCNRNKRVVLMSVSDIKTRSSFIVARLSGCSADTYARQSQPQLSNLFHVP